MPAVVDLELVELVEPRQLVRIIGPISPEIPLSWWSRGELMSRPQTPAPARMRMWGRSQGLRAKGCPQAQHHSTTLLLVDEIAYQVKPIVYVEI